MEYKQREVLIIEIVKSIRRRETMISNTNRKFTLKNLKPFTKMVKLKPLLRLSKRYQYQQIQISRSKSNHDKIWVNYSNQSKNETKSNYKKCNCKNKIHDKVNQCKNREMEVVDLRIKVEASLLY